MVLLQRLGYLQIHYTVKSIDWDFLSYPSEHEKEKTLSTTFITVIPWSTASNENRWTWPYYNTPCTYEIRLLIKSWSVLRKFWVPPFLFFILTCERLGNKLKHFQMRIRFICAWHFCVNSPALYTRVSRCCNNGVPRARLRSSIAK